MSGAAFRYGNKVREVYLPFREEAAEASGLEILRVSLRVCFT